MKIDRLKLIASLEAKNDALVEKYEAEIAKYDEAILAHKATVKKHAKVIQKAIADGEIVDWSCSEDYSYEDGERKSKGTKVWLTIAGEYQNLDLPRNSIPSQPTKPEKQDTFWIGGQQTNKFQQRAQVIESLKLSDDESITLTVSIKGLL
jgi:hypothetical protein